MSIYLYISGGMCNNKTEEKYMKVYMDCNIKQMEMA
jgi:hypothetical protein